MLLESIRVIVHPTDWFRYMLAGYSRLCYPLLNFENRSHKTTLLWILLIILLKQKNFPYLKMMSIKVKCIWSAEIFNLVDSTHLIYLRIRFCWSNKDPVSGLSVWTAYIINRKYDLMPTMLSSSVRLIIIIWLFGISETNHLFRWIFILHFYSQGQKLTVNSEELKLFPLIWCTNPSWP